MSSLDWWSSEWFPKYGQRYYNHPYFLTEFDPPGCQGILTIQNGPAAKYKVFTFLYYYYYKYLSSSSWGKSLAQVVKVQVDPISISEVTYCIPG